MSGFVRSTLAPIVSISNEGLDEHGLVPLPEGLTPHSMRRTFISLLLAIGEDVPYVMGQVGHADPKVTLSIYAQVMFRGEGERERLEGLINGSEPLSMGAGAQSTLFGTENKTSEEVDNPVSN
jgi:hypothetical protein